jgi:hypothetical protein
VIPTHDHDSAAVARRDDRTARSENSRAAADRMTTIAMTALDDETTGTLPFAEWLAGRLRP